MKLFEKKEVSHAEAKQLQEEITKLNSLMDSLVTKYEKGDDKVRKVIIDALEIHAQIIEDLKTIDSLGEQCG